MSKLTEIIKDSLILTGKGIAIGDPLFFISSYTDHCIQKGFNVGNLKEAYKDVQDNFLTVNLIFMGAAIGYNLITNYIKDNFEIVHEEVVYPPTSAGRRYIGYPPRIRRKHKPAQ